MKRRNIVITVVCIVVIFVLIIFLYYISIRSNLIKLEKEVSKCWTELYTSITEKNKLLQVYCLEKHENIKEISDFNKMLLENQKESRSYEKNCQLEFVNLEYNLNKSLIKIKRLNESFFLNNEIPITKIDSMINIKIDTYNNHVQIFNEFYTLFPNIIVAKYLGYIKKNFFTIKYGVNNDDPIVKSKEIPEWANGVDTTFLTE